MIQERIKTSTENRNKKRNEVRSACSILNKGERERERLIVYGIPHPQGHEFLWLIFCILLAKMKCLILSTTGMLEEVGDVMD